MGTCTRGIVPGDDGRNNCAMESDVLGLFVARGIEDGSFVVGLWEVAPLLEVGGGMEGGFTTEGVDLLGFGSPGPDELEGKVLVGAGEN